MRAYLDLLQLIFDTGIPQQDRTGVGTRSVFGHQLRFDLAEGFPLLTTKKLHLRSIIVELLWFLRGETNIAWLKENRVRIWDEWADESGDLGPVYGKQWRHWETADGREIDQIAGLIDLIQRDPASRRQIVTAWNPGELSRMALAPCLCLFRPRSRPGRLNLQLLPAQRRVFGRAVQHRKLRVAHPHAARSNAGWSRASSSGPAAIATSRQPSGAGRAAIGARARGRFRS